MMFLDIENSLTIYRLGIYDVFNGDRFSECMETARCACGY